MNNYVAFYSDKKIEVKAGSSHDAQKQAVAIFAPPKSKRHMVHVLIAEKDGAPVSHSTAGT